MGRVLPSEESFALDIEGICNLNADVVFFPVRHHSPLCARLVEEMIYECKPEAVLIEGPVDFNPHLAEIHFSHRLPIAIYSYVRTKEESSLGAYYPFCEYSPEWRALKVAQKLGVSQEFIDLPWSHLAQKDERVHRYADTEMRHSEYVDRLCRLLFCRNFDSLWDTLFEMQQNITLSEFLERFHNFCYALRYEETEIHLNETKREQFMFEKIQEAQKKYKKILVITGGYHSFALYARLQKISFPGTKEVALPNPELAEQGIALTPYSFERLDSLKGYNAGMPSPGFYQKVWENRLTPDLQCHQALLSRLIRILRKKKQVVSSADWIAVETTAQSLASLRGHPQVWRDDLVDAVRSSLIKEEIDSQKENPFLAAVYQVFRGENRGELSSKTSLPPLVKNIRRLLEEHKLFPLREYKIHKWDIAEKTSREKSHILHQLKILGIQGFSRISGSDLTKKTDFVELWEEWKIVWSPEFDSSCIESAAYGTELKEAAMAYLLESSQNDEMTSEEMALIILRSALAGLNEVGEKLYQRLNQLILKEGNFLILSQTLRHILYLYCYDEFLGTRQFPLLGEVLDEAFQRGLWLLEGLGQVSEKTEKVFLGIGYLLEIWDRCSEERNLSPEEFVTVLQRVSTDSGQSPDIRGAATGALWKLKEANSEGIQSSLVYFAQPQKLGDFLTGLFSTARETIQRDKGLLLHIDKALGNYNYDEFLIALPALRLAFTYFTPREKHYLATHLLEALNIRETPLPLEVSTEIALVSLSWEEKIFQVVEKYGLRGRKQNGGANG